MARNKSPERQDFENVKREYWKEHPRICSRCGFDYGVHLHHKKPLAHGGTNDFENLIPLCSVCHNEWHMVEKMFDFEMFLDLPNMSELFSLHKLGVKILFEMDGELHDLKTAIFHYRTSTKANKIREFLIEQEEKKRKAELREQKKREKELRKKSKKE